MSLRVECSRLWKRQKSDTSPTGYYRRRGKLNIFLYPRACIRAELRIFHTDMGVPNSIYRHISSYSFIFSTYLFLHISFIFTTSRDSRVRRHQGGGGREVYSRILKLPPRSRAGNFSKSPGHFSECDVVRGSGGGYSQILIILSGA